MFYKALPSRCRHVLIFEDDAIIRDASNLPSFLNYAHLGAPWRWCAEQWCRYGGNGGASLRRKDVMLDVIQEIQCSTNYSCASVDLYRETEYTVGDNFNQEDMFLAKQLFSRRLAYENLIPSHLEHLQFAVETMYYENPVWLHKPWPYLHPVNVIELMAKAFTHYELPL